MGFGDVDDTIKGLMSFDKCLQHIFDHEYILRMKETPQLEWMVSKDSKWWFTLFSILKLS